MARLIAMLQGAGLALLGLWVELQVGEGWHAVTQSSIGTVGTMLMVAGLCLGIGRSSR